MTWMNIDSYQRLMNIQSWNPYGRTRKSTKIDNTDCNPIEAGMQMCLRCVSREGRLKTKNLKFQKLGKTFLLTWPNLMLNFQVVYYYIHMHYTFCHPPLDLLIHACTYLWAVLKKLLREYSWKPKAKNRRHKLCRRFVLWHIMVV